MQWGISGTEGIIEINVRSCKLAVSATDREIGLRCDVGEGIRRSETGFLV